MRRVVDAVLRMWVRVKMTSQAVNVMSSMPRMEECLNGAGTSPICHQLRIYRERKKHPPDWPIRLNIQCPSTPPTFPSPISHHNPDMCIQSQIPSILPKQCRSRFIPKRSVTRSYTPSISLWHFERHVSMECHVLLVLGWYRC
jgi:hypothetical protein